MSTIAALNNVSRCVTALQKTIDKTSGLPGMAAFYGPSGYGKSFAASYAANKFKACYIECKSTWTTKALLQNILKELGIAPAKTNYDMSDQISEHLALSQTPLIIDEADYIVNKKMIEVVRDIYESSGAPILLIGEENLPLKLRAWERFHNRILEWEAANPATASDVRTLASMYCIKVEVTDDLLMDLSKTVKGNVRRICVNLDKIQGAALVMGKRKMDLKTWQTSGKQYYTGEPTPRRGGK